MFSLFPVYIDSSGWVVGFLLVCFFLFLFCRFTNNLENFQYLFFDTTCRKNYHISWHFYVANPLFFWFLLPLSVLTFWLCKRSLLCSPVSCLIIEDSVCLLGAPPYPLIKACVCVCLFISCYYSRYSPGALKRHKSGVPVEANTVSCRCSFTHVTKNEFLSLKKKKKTKNLSDSLFIVWSYCVNNCIIISVCCRELSNEKQQKVDCPLFVLVSSPSFTSHFVPVILQ